MTRKKYVTSDGLAFSEEKDMKKLSELAKEGWILDEQNAITVKKAG